MTPWSLIVALSLALPAFVGCNHDVASGEDLATPVDSAVTSPPGCACLPEVPPGWSGPLSFADVEGAVPPACPAGSLGEAFRGNAGLRADPGSCACTCGAPHDLGCYYSVVRVMTDNHSCTCTPDGCYAIDPGNWPAGQCVTNGSKSIPGPVLSISFDGFVAPYGLCDPGEPAPPLAPTWERTAVACRGIAGRERCSDGRSCLVTPPAPFEATACVVRDGDLPCPAGAYGFKRTYYSGVADDRRCGPCKCGPATGMSCSLTLEGYATPECDVPTLKVKLATGMPLPGCTTGADVRFVRDTDITVSGGACAAQPGAPMGTAEPTGPVTVCCLN